MAEKRRWKEIDILRGMAILMVLLYHSIIVYPLNLHEIWWCRTLHTFLWTVQMPLFFLVSGFCYSLRGSYREYALRRCRRILIPHIVFSMLDILPRLIPGRLVHERMEWKEALLDFLLYGGSDWFLWTLFVIALLFPALDMLLRAGGLRRRIGFLIPAVLFFAKPFVTDFLLLDMVCQYLLYFLIGYMLREKAARLLPLLERKRNLPAAFICMSGLFAGLCVCEAKSSPELLEIFLELLCVLASFVLFFALASCCRGICAAFFTECGSWSLQMYLLDAYALVATRTVFVLILGIRNPVFIIAGNFILDTAIVLLLSRYILTKAKVFRIFCGIPEKN